MARTPRPRRIGTAGVVLLLLGIAFAGLSRIAAGAERHAYSPGAVPPASVRVSSGQDYLISVPGGVDALSARGVDPSGLHCEWSTDGSAARTLEVRPAGADTKATNAIAAFTAPTSGPIHVDCAGWGAVFVDDADDASFDLAGLFLVLCIAALLLGAGLGLSGLRSRRSGREPDSPGPVREDDEIERLVDVVRVRSEDGEVGDADRGDVRP